MSRDFLLREITITLPRNWMNQLNKSPIHRHMLRKSKVGCFDTNKDRDNHVVYL